MSSFGSQARLAELEAAAAARVRQAKRELEEAQAVPKNNPISLVAFTKPASYSKNKGHKLYKPLTADHISGISEGTEQDTQNLDDGTGSLDGKDKSPSPVNQSEPASGTIHSVVPPKAPRSARHEAYLAQIAQISQVAQPVPVRPSTRMSQLSYQYPSQSIPRAAGSASVQSTPTHTRLHRFNNTITSGDMSPSKQQQKPMEMPGAFAPAPAPATAPVPWPVATQSDGNVYAMYGQGQQGYVPQVAYSSGQQSYAPQATYLGNQQGYASQATISNGGQQGYAQATYSAGGHQSYAQTAYSTGGQQSYAPQASYATDGQQSYTPQATYSTGGQQNYAPQASYATGGQQSHAPQATYSTVGQQSYVPQATYSTVGQQGYPSQATFLAGGQQSFVSQANNSTGGQQSYALQTTYSTGDQQNHLQAAYPTGSHSAQDDTVYGPQFTQSPFTTTMQPPPSNRLTTEPGKSQYNMSSRDNAERSYEDLYRNGFTFSKATLKDIEFQKQLQTFRTEEKAKAELRDAIRKSKEESEDNDIEPNQVSKVVYPPTTNNDVEPAKATRVRSSTLENAIRNPAPGLPFPLEIGPPSFAEDKPEEETPEDIEWRKRCQALLADPDFLTLNPPNAKDRKRTRKAMAKAEKSVTSMIPEASITRQKENTLESANTWFHNDNRGGNELRDAYKTKTAEQEAKKRYEAAAAKNNGTVPENFRIGVDDGLAFNTAMADVAANLASYVLTDDPQSEQQRANFHKVSEVPEWAIAHTTDESKSYFGGGSGSSSQYWSQPPQRVARDPRFRLTPGASSKNSKGAPTNTQSTGGFGVIGSGIPRSKAQKDGKW